MLFLSWNSFVKIVVLRKNTAGDGYSEPEGMSRYVVCVAVDELDACVRACVERVRECVGGACAPV